MCAEIRRFRSGSDTRKVRGSFASAATEGCSTPGEDRTGMRMSGLRQRHADDLPELRSIPPQPLLFVPIEQRGYWCFQECAKHLVPLNRVEG